MRFFTINFFIFSCLWLGMIDYSFSQHGSEIHHDDSHIHCETLPKEKDRREKNDLPTIELPASNLTLEEALLLESDPLSPYVIFMSIETVDFKDPDYIFAVWEIAVEDYRPFNVNITTNPVVYAAAEESKKVKVSFNQSAGALDGACKLNAFGEPDGSYKCYVKTKNTRLGIATHEIGHALGLNHDGSWQDGAYHKGNADWFPIMGSDIPMMDGLEYGTFSKGEYELPSNTEDDFKLISQHLPYKVDLHGDDLATASNLRFVKKDTVFAKDNHGIIEKDGDQDLFKFSTNGGKINLNIIPFKRWNNLHVKANLLNEQGNIVIEGTALNHGTTLDQAANITGNLVAGQYYLSVSNQGTNNYSSYGSVGFFEISGVIENSSIGQEANDVVLASVDVPELLCGEGFSPKIEVINYGSKPLLFFKADVYINDVLEYTDDLSANLKLGEEAIFNLSIITEYGMNKKIEVKLHSPNNATENNIQNNNLITYQSSDEGDLIRFSISKNDISESQFKLTLTNSSTNTEIFTVNHSDLIVDNILKVKKIDFCLAKDCYEIDISQPFLGCAYPEWEAKVYSQPKTFVIHKGIVYQNSYYAESTNNPLNGGPWKKVSDSCIPENSKLVLEKTSDKLLLEHFQTDLGLNDIHSTFCTDDVVNDITASKKETIDIYPNPSTDIIYIKFNTLLEQPINIQITDVFGNTLIQESIQKSVDIDFLPSGMYFITVEHPTSKLIYTHKIIKK